MKSKVLIAIAIALFVGGVFFVLSGSGKKLISPISEKESVKTTPTLPTSTPAEQTLTWNDPAGFAFKYSSSIKINNHPEDNVNYAHLDLTANGKQGGVLILAEDSKYKTLDLWFKTDSRVKGGASLDLTLGGKTAKKVSVSSGGKVIIGVIDDGLLFTVELNPGAEGYYKKIFDQIVSSFEFTPLPTEKSSSSTSGSGSSGGGENSSDVVEEEEIIE